MGRRVSCGNSKKAKKCIFKNSTANLLIISANLHLFLLCTFGRNWVLGVVLESVGIIFD